MVKSLCFLIFDIFSIKIITKIEMNKLLVIKRFMQKFINANFLAMKSDFPQINL